MAERANDPYRRADPRERTRRDLERLRKRDTEGRFWRSMSVVGAVGWPIVLLATGGALFGRVLDAHWGSGVRVTLALLGLGTLLGTWIALRTLRGGGS